MPQARTEGTQTKWTKPISLRNETLTREALEETLYDIDFEVADPGDKLALVLGQCEVPAEIHD